MICLGFSLLQLLRVTSTVITRVLYTIIIIISSISNTCIIKIIVRSLAAAARSRADDARRKDTNADNNTDNTDNNW